MKEARLPQFWVQMRWPESWRVGAEEPVKLEYEPWGSSMYVGLLGPDEAAWEMAYARPEGEGADGDCALHVYETRDLTLDDFRAIATRARGVHS